jgi:hypothetical protein
MHIHTTQASALGNALAAAQDAETAMSLRRARELREAAARLKAVWFEAGSGISSELQMDPETAAQTASMITAWSGGDSAAARSGSFTQEQSVTDGSFQNGLAWTGSSQVEPAQKVQRIPAFGPVSYWA